jgi:hypothetical protein
MDVHQSLISKAFYRSSQISHYFMTTIFKEIQILKDEGKLHAKLLNRTRVLFIISTILLLISLFNVVFRDTSVLWALVLAIVGLLAGLYLFSKMSVYNWNEEEEIVVMGKMDTVGYLSLALYVVFEISLRTFLKDYFPTTVLPLLFAGIGGTLIGRAIGTLLEIHKVYLQQHSH